MIQTTDTIAAIATALSPSGISIIRISGPEAMAIASGLFYRNGHHVDVAAYPSHTVQYGYITEPESDTVIDEVMMLILKSPKTFTREDTIEIDCHGGIIVTKRILQAVLKAGARLAEPGEFTKRAYLNGRIDLTQAEAVADVISAKNELSLKNSMKQLKGRVRRDIMLLREEILREIAQIEATLDDPEHLSFDGFTEKITESTERHLKIVTHLAETAENGRLIHDGIRTVILGKPNAGKSSLLNALLGENRAIVTDIAGTTRDTLTEEIHYNGITLLLMDTAGIRNTEDTVEKIGVERAKNAADEADLILYVTDSSANLDDNDEDIIRQYGNRPMIALLNKSDLTTVTGPEALQTMLRKFDCNAEIIEISAKNETGINRMQDVISSMFFENQIQSDEEYMITSERHRQALLAAQDSLKRVQDSISTGMPEDFYTIDLTAAYESLGTILGEELDEDIINTIFSEFCMGK